MSSNKSKLSSSSSKLPILVYNIAGLILWLVILLKTVTNFYFNNYTVLKDKSLLDALKFVQITQYLDVLFSLAGMSHKKLAPSLIQCLARNSVVWFIFPYTLESVYPTIAIISWCLNDMTRFSNYVNQVAGIRFKFLQVLRYSAFLVLYPSAFTGEVFSVSNGLTNLLQSNNPKERLFFLGNELPIEVVSFMQLYRIMAIFVLVVMYAHMLRRRSKFFQKRKERKQQKMMSKVTASYSRAYFAKSK